MKLFFKIVGALLLAVVLLLGAILVEAHVEIRGVDPALPELAELRRAIRVSDGPQSIHVLNTASQVSPEGVMAHPSFIFEWADGRVFLVDVGMDEAGAIAFGRPLEAMLGADPIKSLGSVAERLGAALGRVQGAAFSHLHIDHTGGLEPLCEARGRPIGVYQTSWQAERGNYSTKPGDDVLTRASCTRRERLEDAAISAIPGFPGLVAIAAGGHTPGSTVFVARVGDVTWILAGDVSNSKSALLANEPKPLVYSLFIVPESPTRLERMRLWLSALDAEPDMRVIVSHDQAALEGSGIPAWEAN